MSCPVVPKLWLFRLQLWLFEIWQVTDALGLYHGCIKCPGICVSFVSWLIGIDGDYSDFELWSLGIWTLTDSLGLCQRLYPTMLNGVSRDVDSNHLVAVGTYGVVNWWTATVSTHGVVNWWFGCCWYHDCLNICNSCMPTMIVRDSMTVVFSKVEVPTITCVGFLKPCWTKEKWHVWLTLQVVCSQYPFLVHDRLWLCRNCWKDYNCPDCWNRSVLCLYPFFWSIHLNLFIISSRR